MKRIKAYRIFFSLLFGLALFCAQAQRPNVLQGVGNRVKGFGQQGGSSGNDSIIARDKFEDSLTLTYFYLDSTRGYKLDSSIADFTKHFPIPPTNIYLGNTGTATKSILFSPYLKAGWNPGFHALDVYKWKLENVQFFNTTRPYTELGYLLGARA